MVCRNCEERGYIDYPWCSENLGEDCGHSPIGNFCLLKYQETKDWTKAEIQHIEQCAEFCPKAITPIHYPDGQCIQKEKSIQKEEGGDMKSLKKLQASVEKMLANEAKRRAIALHFVEGLYEVLFPAAADIWGDGEEGHTIWIKENHLYLRYDKDDEKEERGIYSSNTCPKWGRSIESLTGSDFWEAIRIVAEWIPTIIEILSGKEQSREEVLALL